MKSNSLDWFVFIRFYFTRIFSINRLSNEMKNFLEYTYQIVRKSLERYLYQIQQTENLKQQEEQNKKKGPEDFKGGSKLRAILRDSKTNSKKLPLIDGKKGKYIFRSNSPIFLLRIISCSVSNDFSVQ